MAHGTVWPATTALAAGDNPIDLGALNNDVPPHGIRVFNSRLAGASIFLAYDTPASQGMIEVQPGQLWQDAADDPAVALLSVLHIYSVAGGISVNGTTTGGVTVWATLVQRGAI